MTKILEFKFQHQSFQRVFRLYYFNQKHTELWAIFCVSISLWFKKSVGAYCAWTFQKGEGGTNWEGSVETYTLPCVMLCQVASVVSNSLQPHGLKPTKFLCPWDSPSKNTGVGFHTLLQGIFSTQGSRQCTRSRLLNLGSKNIQIS